MQATKPRKIFKKRFGQSNHFLITTLIGLDAIVEYNVDKPKTFSTSWNPQDKRQSVDRTRIFILQSFLGNAVESLEMYFKLIRKDSYLLQINTLIDKEFDENGSSTYCRFRIIAEKTKADPIIRTLVEVLICIRNSIFHYDTNIKIEKNIIDILNDNIEKIKEEFCGLDVSILLKKINDANGRKIDLCFKEVSSLINAMHQYIESIDEYIIENLNFENFIYNAMLSKLNNKKKLKSFTDTRLLRYIQTTLQNNFCVPPENLKLYEGDLLIKLKESLS